MKLSFTTYDVFTNRRFGGNPLAIVEEADALSTEQMQTIAREFNLSETIFVRTPKDPANTAILGIMAPLEATLDDEKLAGVMTYVRNSFGNKADVVTPEDAKKFREMFKDIKAPVLRADLEKTAASHKK